MAVKLQLDEIKQILSQNKPLLQRKYKVKELGIFGSYVRGENRDESDIDILVEFKEPVSLFEFMELEEFLTKLLGAKVDLVMKGGLKQRIRGKILAEAVYV